MTAPPEPEVEPEPAPETELPEATPAELAAEERAELEELRAERAEAARAATEATEAAAAAKKTAVKKVAAKKVAPAPPRKAVAPAVEPPAERRRRYGSAFVFGDRAYEDEEV